MSLTVGSLFAGYGGIEPRAFLWDAYGIGAAA